MFHICKKTPKVFFMPAHIAPPKAMGSDGGIQTNGGNRFCGGAIAAIVSECACGLWVRLAACVFYFTICLCLFTM